MVYLIMAWLFFKGLIFMITIISSSTSITIISIIISSE